MRSCRIFKPVASEGLLNHGSTKLKEDDIKNFDNYVLVLQKNIIFYFKIFRIFGIILKNTNSFFYAHHALLQYILIFFFFLNFIFLYFQIVQIN